MKKIALLVVAAAAAFAVTACDAIKENGKRVEPINTERSNDR